MRASWDAKASQRSTSEQIWVLRLAKDATTQGYVFNEDPDEAVASINVEGGAPITQRNHVSCLNLPRQSKMIQIPARFSCMPIPMLAVLL